LARGQVYYCEMCGSKIAGRPYRALVDGVEMVLCVSCYLKLTKSGRAKPLPARAEKKREAPKRRKPATRKISLELYDIVEDYDERIRRAREAKGWTTAVLAQKLRISESMLKKIESGKMKPSIDLARKMEKLLRIQLLEPVEIEEEVDYTGPPGTVTLGDVVVVRKDED